MLADDIVINQWVAAGIVAIVVALWVALGIIGKLLLKAKDDQAAELREQRDSLKKAADHAVTILEMESARRQIEQRIVPIPMVAPVIPEKNSPTTERQMMAAEFQTINARLIAAELGLKSANSVAAVVTTTVPNLDKVDILIEEQVITATQTNSKNASEIDKLLRNESKKEH